jgi:hypothetical protein
MHIITLTDAALRDFLAELSDGKVHTVRVARDETTVMFKVNEGGWTAPYPIAAEDAHRINSALGNWNAREGCDRCYCGTKYWQGDRCIDCSTSIHTLLRDPEWVAENRPGVPA